MKHYGCNQVHEMTQDCFRFYFGTTQGKEREKKKEKHIIHCDSL